MRWEISKRGLIAVLRRSPLCVVLRIEVLLPLSLFSFRLLSSLPPLPSPRYFVATPSVDLPRSGCDRLDCICAINIVVRSEFSAMQCKKLDDTSLGKFRIGTPLLLLLPSLCTEIAWTTIVTGSSAGR